MIIDKLQTYFKVADMFGQNISLNLNGDDAYKTGMGGFCSCLIIIIVSVFFQSNIIEFMAKSNINSEITTVFEEDPDRIVMEDEEFMFALAIEQTNFTTNPYFNISIKARTYDRLDNGTIVKYENFTNLIPCTLDRFQIIFNKYGQNFTEQFNQLGLSSWLCPDYKYNLTVGGRYTSKTFDFIKIEVTDCSNNTKNNSYLTWKPQCASKEQAQTYLDKNGSFRIKLYMTNKIISPHQPTDFVQLFLDDELFFSFIPTKLSRESDIYLKKYKLQTDQSLVPVFDDLEGDDIFIKEYSDYRDITQLGSQNDKLYTALYLRRSPFTVRVERWFQKVDDLLSYLGGFANIIVVFLGFFIGFYNKQQYLIELANKIYNFDFGGNNKQQTQNAQIARNITRIKKTYIKPPTGTNQTVMQNAKSLPQEENQSDTMKQKQQPKTHQELSRVEDNNKSAFQREQERIIEKLGFKTKKDYLSSQFLGILNRSQPLAFSLRFLINQASCGKLFNDNRCQMLDKAINKISDDIDLFVLLEKVKETTLLKELLLSKEQQILFNFTPKPVLSLQEEKPVPSRLFMDLQSIKKQKTDSSYPSKAKFGAILDLAISKQKTKVHNGYHEQLKGYYKLYKAYDKLIAQNKKNDHINEQLIKNLGQEIQDIFEVSQFIDFDNSKQKISNRIQYILKKKVKRMRAKKQVVLVRCSDDDDSENIEIFSVERNRSYEGDILNRQIGFPNH